MPDWTGKANDVVVTLNHITHGLPDVTLRERRVAIVASELSAAYELGKAEKDQQIQELRAFMVGQIPLFHVCDSPNPCSACAWEAERSSLLEKTKP